MHRSPADVRERELHLPCVAMRQETVGHDVLVDFGEEAFSIRQQLVCKFWVVGRQPRPQLLKVFRESVRR